jgi:hypothetical protein
MPGENSKLVKKSAVKGTLFYGPLLALTLMGAFNFLGFAGVQWTALDFSLAFAGAYVISAFITTGASFLNYKRAERALVVVPPLSADDDDDNDNDVSSDVTSAASLTEGTPLLSAAPAATSALAARAVRARITYTEDERTALNALADRRAARANVLEVISTNIFALFAAGVPTVLNVGSTAYTIAALAAQGNNSTDPTVQREYYELTLLQTKIAISVLCFVASFLGFNTDFMLNAAQNSRQDERRPLERDGAGTRHSTGLPLVPRRDSIDGLAAGDPASRPVTPSVGGAPASADATRATSATGGNQYGQFPTGAAALAAAVARAQAAVNAAAASHQAASASVAAVQASAQYLSDHATNTDASRRAAAIANEANEARAQARHQAEKIAPQATGLAIKARDEDKIDDANRAADSAVAAADSAATHAATAKRLADEVVGLETTRKDELAASLADTLGGDDTDTDTSTPPLPLKAPRGDDGEELDLTNPNAKAGEATLDAKALAAGVAAARAGGARAADHIYQTVPSLGTDSTTTTTKPVAGDDVLPRTPSPR